MSYPSIPCSKCKHPTRAQRITIAQAPGTFVRKGTVCQRCYKEEHPLKVVKDYKKLSRERAAAEVVDIAHTLVGLEGFMAERRARIEARGTR